VFLLGFLALFSARRRSRVETEAAAQGAAEMCSRVKTLRSSSSAGPTKRFIVTVSVPSPLLSRERWAEAPASSLQSVHVTRSVLVSTR
jgi:hypothetical protein